MQSIRPFLMFQGEAKEALALYQETFSDFHLLQIHHYPDSAGESANKVESAVIEINGQQIQMIDSPVEHNFSFTPSFSFFLTFTADDEFESVFAALSEGGDVLMPPDDYGFSRRFAWLNDPYGVSWQLNLE